MSQWWSEHAWLGGSWTSPGVLLEENNGYLTAITPGLIQPPEGARRLRGLTLPGLANVHSHAFHRALRGRTQERQGNFWTWRELMYSVASRIDPDSYLRLARAVYGEMALAGFTAVGEFHYLHHGPGGVPYDDPNEMGVCLMAAAQAAGIRLTLLDTCYLRGGFESALEGPQQRFGDHNAQGWVNRVSDLRPVEGVHLGAAIHSVRALHPVDMADVAAWVDKQVWPLHAHVSEQTKEQSESRSVRGTTPLGVLAAAGAVGPRFTAIHGTHLSKKDIKGLANTGGGCCFCPTTERDLGDGIGPATALLEAGIPLSIGSDSHAVIDGFEETRAIELDCRLATQKRGLISPESLLTSATSVGMAALGWDTGTLAVGQLADFITVRMDSPRTAGCDPTSISTAVFAASAADVADVVIGGRKVVEDGRHLLIQDVAAELAAAISALWV